MNHWMVLPVLIPLLTAMSCAFIGRGNRNLKRMLGLGGLLATLGVAIYMLTVAATGAVTVYAIGNWEVPLGIVFVLDRLSAVMVVLTNVLALFAYLYAITGPDEKSHYFHFLFLMEVTGVNGAFLTGDIFNLFVFFEILLLSAYVLVIYGGGPARVRTGIQYVLLNLVGSSLFLIAVGVIYAIAGTLNMADLAVKIAEVGAQDAMLLRAASYMLITVFSIKAALFPVYFWLPHSYAAASAPVAALFAIMTKVGVYAILRTTTLIFDGDAGYVANLMEPYLLPFALVTAIMAVVGVLGAMKLRTMIAYMLISSVGTILAGIGLYTADGISGSLYYMMHSTLVMGALFLIADLVMQQRGNHLDTLHSGPQVREPLLLGMLYFVAMIAAGGLPPLTGFIGKALILDAGIGSARMTELWVVLLVGSFFILVAIVRAGTGLFWKAGKPLETNYTSARVKAVPIVAILACLILMSVLAGPISGYMDQAAVQLLDSSVYVNAVMGGQP